MLRKNIHITESQYLFLKALSEDNKENIPLAEHIRRAIDKYIADIKKINVSSSESKVIESYGDK